jgi:hypothetical protein
MKPRQLLLRLGLIGVLPLIALTLYVKGQKYDAALLDFTKVRGQETSNAPALIQTAAESVSSAAVSDFADFRRVGQERRYTKDNLYEHVNGHAEYFISAGFESLAVAQYVPAGSSTSKTEIQTEVYDMGNDIQAFGVLVDESGENSTSVSIGTMGYRNPGGINFIKGHYYVKITASDPKLKLMTFAKAFAETLPPATGSFATFERLPRIGTEGKTRFIKEGYRGLDFFHNVIEREYTIDGRKIILALLAGSRQEMTQTVPAFLEYVRKSGIPIEQSEQAYKTIYKVKDKYEGSWFLIASPNAVFAVFGTDDNAVLGHFMKIGDGGANAIEKQ